MDVAIETSGALRNGSKDLTLERILLTGSGLIALAKDSAEPLVQGQSV